MPVEADKESLLVEYQAAQSSAQHHDGLVWNVTNILWATALVLYGFILTKLGIKDLRILLTILSLIGLLMILYAWFCALQFSFIRNQKYKRCKEIETKFGLKQHTELEHPKYFQRVFYGFLVFVLASSWAFLIAFIWIA